MNHQTSFGFIFYKIIKTDIIWLHTICKDSNNLCIAYLHNNSNSVSDYNYSLTNTELNNINTSSLAKLYLGDYTTKIHIIYINGYNSIQMHI